MTSALSFPTERTAPPKDLEVRPKQVRVWIQGLQLAQCIDATKKVSMHLAAINRARLDLDDRLQILDAYRPVAATLLDELDAIYGKASIPLGARPREALLLARDLATQMSVGYRIAIAESSAKLISFGAKKQLPTFVLRAMQYLAAMLRASYKSYTPVPQGVWRELHQLYLLADRERIVAEIADPDTKDAVITVYCECLLLSLTDPYRLVPGEADKVIAQIRSSRAPVTLGQQRPQTRAGGHFIVPCDTDKPPKPALSASDDNGGPNWRLLDANALVDRIRMRQQAMETGNVSATTSKLVGPDGLALMAKLMVLWGDPPKRAYRRNPAEGTVAVCVGIKAVTHFVSLSADLESEARKEAFRKGITMPLPTLRMDDATQEIPVFEYEVVNESEGGLKVRRMSSTPQAIGVGEVAGIKMPGKPGWVIAVVRWITLYDEGGMEYGVQFLSTAARTVSVQPTITSSSTQARLGLLLTDPEDPSAGETLLTPINTFSDLREFELEEEGKVSCVRAHHLIEKTGRFELFHVSPS
ncbi:MAG TPA: hypothetical protein VM122_03280 [Usitatibacter sp.]|nr:hypothetical protein [Usitatibacter sp.]